MTVPEVRRLLVALIWTAPTEPGLVLAWSRWRRRHQARIGDASSRCGWRIRSWPALAGVVNR
jgi:hypothetical protein